ncbi:MAG: hypothetical protein ACWGQW_02835 [bacterium]
MEYFHYLYAQGDGANVCRILSTHAPEHHVEAFVESRNTKKVVRTSKGGLVYAMDTGTWTFPVLDRAISKGVPFKIVSYNIADVANWDDEKVTKMLKRANFAMASPTNLTLFSFPGYKGFDLKPLGLEIDNAKKLVKRLNEVLRCTGHGMMDETLGEITHRMFALPDGIDPIVFDGMNFIRDSFAKKLGFKDEYRVNGRFTTPDGVIKGDWIRVPDSVLDVDLLWFEDNLKPEYRTNGTWQVFTAMVHHPEHDMGHNDQIRADFSFFIPVEQVKEDLILMVRKWKKSVREGGDLYNYLVKQGEAFDDPIAIDLDRVTLATRLEEVAELLKSVGIPPAMFSNIPYTRTGALLRRLRAFQMRDDNGRALPTFKKMFIPATNAFSGAVVTYEALTMMGGLDFEDEDGTRTFFHPLYGLVIPGSRFVATYDLHGGHDQDDAHSMWAIKVFCSNLAQLEVLVELGVVDPELDIPEDAEHAVEAALAIRMPNGPGEYSIERVSPDMPWRFYNPEKVRTVDLADAPKPQQVVFEGASMVELPTSVDYNVAYDREFVGKVVAAQCINPGVGGFANVIMTAAAVFGPDNIPGDMVKLKMEDTIDTVQQEADFLKFAIIESTVKEMWISFVDYVLENEVKIDAGLLATRVPLRVGVGKDSVPIAEAILEANLAGGGDTYELHQLYQKAIDTLGEAAKAVAHQARNNLPLARKIRNGKFSRDLQTFAVGWLRGCNRELKQIDARFRGDDPEVGDDTWSTLLRRAKQEEKRLALEEAMDRRVDTILENDRHDTHKQIMALYAMIVTPNEQFPAGDNDRVFVQPTSPGHVSMIQLFIEACKRWNLIGDQVTLKADRLERKES